MASAVVLLLVVAVPAVEMVAEKVVPAVVEMAAEKVLHQLLLLAVQLESVVPVLVQLEFPALYHCESLVTCGSYGWCGLFYWFCVQFFSCSAVVFFFDFV